MHRADGLVPALIAVAVATELPALLIQSLVAVLLCAPVAYEARRRRP